MIKNKKYRLFVLFVLLALALVVGLPAQANADSTIGVELRNSDGTLLPGGSLRYHDGSWKTATDLGDGTFEVSTSASSVTYEMTYNNGRQTFSNVSAATNPVIFTTVTTTPALKDSVPNLLSGGTVRYHQIGWQNWGAANTPQELLPGNYTFEMTFNNGRQTYSNYAVPADPSHEVLFTTVSTTVALETSGGGDLGAAGSVRFHQIGWETFGASNTTKELLPGNYTFEMTYNNGRQTYSNYPVPAGASEEVLFKTVTTTVALEDFAGSMLDGGTVRFHQIGWEDFGNANTNMELLPGDYTIEMTYNNGRQTYSGHTVPAVDDHEVLFTTVTTTVALKDSGGGSLFDTGLGVGTVRFHQIGWQNFGDANTNQELLPGNYTFEMTYNNGRQTYSNHTVPAGDTHEELFTTTTTTVRVENCSSGGHQGASIRFHQIGWQNFGSTDVNGNVVKELLPGNYTFEATYNNGRQTYSNYGIPAAASHSVVYTTSAVTINYPGTVKYHQLGWVNFVQPTMYLLPGSYTFMLGSTTVSNVAVSGCSFGGLTVKFPGISQVHTYVKQDDGAANSATGAMVASQTYKNDQAQFPTLPNGIFDIVVVKNSKTLILDSVLVLGPTTVEDIVSTMTVKFPGISQVHTYVKVDDGILESAAGGDVDNRTYKNDETSLVVLKGTYDVKVVKNAQTNIIDAVDCTGTSCTVDDIVATLTVSFPGISQVHTYVKVDDGTGSAATGGNVDNRTYKDNGTSLAVLKSTYDVVVVKNARSLIVDSVDCTGATCTVDDIVSTMTVKFPGISQVHTYVKVDDGTLESAAGGDVDNRTYKNDETSLVVLKGVYDVKVVKNAKQKIIDAVDCSADCTVENIVATLTVEFPGLSQVHVYVKLDDALAGQATGGDVDNRTYQNNSTVMAVLRSYYDVVLKKGSLTGIVDHVDCTGTTCNLSGGYLKVYAPNGTKVEVRSSDGSTVITSTSNVGTDKKHQFNGLPIGIYDIYFIQGASTQIVNDLFFVTNTTLDQLCNLTVFGPNGATAEVLVAGTSNNVTGPANFGTDKKHVFDVVKGTYDLYLEQGAATKTVANVACTAESATEDQLNQLTVFGPNGATAEIRVVDTSGKVTGPANFGTDKKNVFDLVKGTYDIYLVQGSATKTVEDIDANGETQSVDQLVQWTVFGPNGATAEVRVTAGNVTGPANFGTDKKQVFDVIPLDFDLKLVQGAGVKNVTGIDVSLDLSTDELCALTVFGPNGATGEVLVAGGGGHVSGPVNFGTDKKNVFDLIKNTYDLELVQGAATKLVSSVDCNGETQTEDQLVQWTVYGPNGATAEVKSGGSNVAGPTNFGTDKKVVFDVVPNTYDLRLIQGAADKTVSGTLVNSNLSNDELCALTVFGPNGATAEVRVVDTNSVVVGPTGFGTDQKNVFDLIKGTYDVYSSANTIEDVNCSGETQSISFLP